MTDLYMRLRITRALVAERLEPIDLDQIQALDPTLGIYRLIVRASTDDQHVATVHLSTDRDSVSLAPVSDSSPAALDDAANADEIRLAGSSAGSAAAVVLS